MFNFFLIKIKHYMSGPYYISTIKGTTRYYIAATQPVSGTDYYVQLINPAEPTKRFPSDLYIESAFGGYNIYTLIGQDKYYLNQNNGSNVRCLNFARGNVIGKDIYFYEDNPSTGGIKRVDIKLDVPLYFERQVSPHEYLSNNTCNILTSHIMQPDLGNFSPSNSSNPAIYQFYISDKPN